MKDENIINLIITVENGPLAQFRAYRTDAVILESEHKIRLIMDWETNDDGSRQPKTILDLPDTHLRKLSETTYALEEIILWSRIEEARRGG